MQNDTLFAEERKLEIVDFINAHKKATVIELSALFNVSNATIRNDLRNLEDKHLIIRTHGGAIVKSSTAFEPDERNKKQQNIALKKKIAEGAVELIDSGDIIILDSGSTTYELSHLLKNKKDLSIVTNDLRIALELEQTGISNVIVIGGSLRKNFHCTYGNMGKAVLENISVDKAFIGTNSISIEHGASTPDANHAEIKRAMISIASKKILLCESSKLEKKSFVRFAGIGEIDTLITDDIDEDIRRRYEEKGVEVVITGQ